MLEWLKRHAWKACIPQKGIRGSNPRLSANPADNQQDFLYAEVWPVYGDTSTSYLYICVPALAVCPRFSP